MFQVTALHIEPVVATVTPLQHGLYDSPPVAPIRKARSRGTSLADEDRTSRGAESLVSETQSYPVDDIPVEETHVEDTETAKEDNFGYAIVEKPEHRNIEQQETLERPARHKRNKPPRPPPISRKKRAATQLMNFKNQGIHFFTYPRRAIKSLHKPPPVRPVRNYSTIGSYQTLPSRPPRRSKVFREPVYADDNIPFMDESEKETLDSSTPKIVTADEIIPISEPTPVIIDSEQVEQKETSGSNDDNKDLQSGDVIEKMKSRPLPAPPRPARKSKGDIQLQNEVNKLNEPYNNDDIIIVTERINIQITPPREVTEIHETSIKTTTMKLNENENKVDDSITKQSSEVKQEPEKKEGPLAALKEMISQKKKEFFEPKKETQTTVKTETVVTKVENTHEKRDNGSLFTIIPLKSDEETETNTVEETNVSTQTDPLPEGYVVEEEQQTTEQKSPVFQQSITKVPLLTTTKLQQPETMIKAPSAGSNLLQESRLSQLPPTSTSRTESKTDNTAPSSTSQEQPRHVQEIHTVIEKKVVVMPDPDTEVSFLKAQKLQVSELDVDKLNVSELQAKKISVSDIDGVSMQISELSSKAGNLVVSGVELPPEFLQNLVSTIASSSSPPQLSSPEQTQASTQTSPSSKESESVLSAPAFESTQQSTTQSSSPTTPVVVYPSQTPIVVYPPQTTTSGQSTISVHPAIIPQMFSPEYAEYKSSSRIPRTRSPPRNLPEDSSHQPEESEDHSSLMPVPTKRHHRHHHHHSHRQSPSPISTDDEAERSSYRKQQILQQQSASQLVRQLLQIWQNSLQDGVYQVIDGLNRAFPEGEKRKDAQTAACIILVLIAGLMIVGFGSSDKTVHHHHWDFQFPPPH